jgi:hypothetical protein
MIKNAPKRIYLQVGDIPTDDLDFKDLHEVTWCEDKINDNDLCYIRKRKCYTPAISKSDGCERVLSLVASIKAITEHLNQEARNEYFDILLEQLGNHAP